MKSHRTRQGGDIDRNRPLNFSFEGRTLSGFAGDTLASALIANDVAVVGRSFKYHRPRGILGAGVEEPNALMRVELGGDIDINVRATEVELAEGLAAKPVNCFPSARFDLGAINNLVSPFIPAGFYYKTFMWPDWHLFEPLIRRAAGLGKLPAEGDQRAYGSVYAHTDVLVVGGGPAGLMAARSAALAGARVMLVEQDPMLGGALRWSGETVDGQDGRGWADATADEVTTYPNVRVLTRTTAIGYFDHNELTLLERRPPGAATSARLWRVRARQVVVAAGAIERPIVFPGNDRPGVMLASAVMRYLGQYGVRAGSRLALFVNNDDAYDLAQAYVKAGGSVAAIIDGRRDASITAGDVPILKGEVIATQGAPELRQISVREYSGAVRRFDVDVLAMSGGWSPTVHLFKQAGGALRWDPERVALRPDSVAQAAIAVGAANGEFELTNVIDDALAGAAAALAALGRAPPASAPRRGARGNGTAPLWRVKAKGKAFVDFQNDVTVSDIALAEREGFRSVEHLKRYTTLGMAPDQGKTSNVNALAIMGELTERSIPEVGTTGYRFPFTPTPIGAFGGFDRGEIFRPARRMPAHDEHVAAGAVLEEYGSWLRPAYYPLAGESAHQAEQREALAVRNGAGLFEGSPLGKIEVKGADAAEFLDRIYANTMSTLKVGKLRYGLMLNELGVAIDDGVTARLSDDLFLVGTTGAGADRIAAWLEEWLQCEWLDLNVIVAPVTTAMAVITISGPKAREILREVGVSFDISAADFPHMSFREGEVGGFWARVCRVSFTGETSYEVNVRATDAPRLWRALVAAGRPHGLSPVGVDAWMLLRTEKGYLHIGADTDGTTTALDLGWGQVLKRKHDFIGRRSLSRPADQSADRLEFVGLESADDTRALPIGAHLRALGVRGPSEGFVTSTGFSPSLGRGVALGMVRGGRSRVGQLMELHSGGRVRHVRVIKPGVYDPEGARLNA